MQDKENEKDVSGKGKIEAKVFKNIQPTWSAAVGQSYEGERQGQKEYEPKKIKSSANEAGANSQSEHEAQPGSDEEKKHLRPRVDSPGSGCAP